MKTERSTQQKSQGASAELPGAQPTLTKDTFASDQDVRWCPGCGDYSILAQTQRVLPELGIPRENIVFISGIGCSSRFPYYMDTYGFHTIHGRGPTIATGLKVAHPELSVWVITGDGDALSIGGNHFIHLMRRNLDLNVLLFNNKIYGLTKGQYSPTSEIGKITKSTPQGSLDPPFNTTKMALASGATFVARTLDRDPKHLQETIRAAYRHKGTSLVEIYQNCNVFNDGAFLEFTERDSKPDHTVVLEDGKPLVFGKDRDKGIRLDGMQPEVVSLSDGKYSLEDLIVHDVSCDDPALAYILSRMTDLPGFPHALGVFRSVQRDCYEDLLNQQIKDAKQWKDANDLGALLNSGDTWVVE